MVVMATVAYVSPRTPRTHQPTGLRAWRVVGVGDRQAN